MREYFRNIRQNRIKLRMAQKRLRDMQENMAAMSSPDLSGMPKGSRSSGDANMAHDVSEILEQEKYIDILKSRTARESIKAEKIIRSLKNPVEAAVLFARYTYGSSEERRSCCSCSSFTSFSRWCSIYR